MTYPYAKNDAGKHTSKQHSIQVTFSFLPLQLPQSQRLLGQTINVDDRTAYKAILDDGIIISISRSVSGLLFWKDEGVDTTSSKGENSSVELESEIINFVGMRAASLPWMVVSSQVWSESA